MQRFVIWALLAVLVGILPIWPFNQQWTFGPAVAVIFLLAVNLLTWAFDHFAERAPLTNLQKPDRI